MVNKYDEIPEGMHLPEANFDAEFLPEEYDSDIAMVNSQFIPTTEIQYNDDELE